MTWKRNGLFFAVSLVAACGGRSLSGDIPDGGWSDARRDGTGRQDGTGPRPDGAPLPDSGPVCNEEDTWRIEDLPLVGLRVLTKEQYPDRIPEGIAVRIQADVELGGCDRFGGLSWWADPGQRLVTVRASLWRYTGRRGCPEWFAVVPKFIVLPAGQLGRGPWTVRDGYPGATDPVTDTFRIGRCPMGDDCFCEGGQNPVPNGQPCTYDCECSYPAVCVHDSFQNPGPYGECLIVCNSDGDCPLDEHCEVLVDDAPSGVCWPGRQGCETDEDCPSGFTCGPVRGGGKLCQPAMDADSVDRACSNDCDCPEGYVCADKGDGNTTCQIPCVSQVECPDILCCGMWLSPNLYTGAYCTMCMDRGY